MANIVYTHGLYNEDLKNEFLSNYPDNTMNSYRRVLLKSYDMESTLGKDIYSFTPKEMDQLVSHFSAPSLLTLRSMISVVNLYIVWAMERQLADNNPLDYLVTQEDWPMRHLAERQWFTARQIEQIEDFCVNAQDAVIFRLLFEGVGGKGLEEIINLQMQDVDFDNKILTLKQGEKTRKLTVSTRLLELVRDANSEVEYYMSNGQKEATSVNVNDTMALIPSHYVVKSARTGLVEGSQATRKTVHWRLNTISERYGTGKISAKVVSMSGMLYYAKLAYERDGKLEKPQYQEVAKRFANNFPWTLKDIINVASIEMVYGVGDDDE